MWPFKELRAFGCGLKLSDPKSAQNLGDPWIAGGQLHTYLWFSSLYLQLLNTPFSPTLIFHLREDGRVSPGLYVKTARRQPSASHRKGLSPGTLRTCTRRPDFCFHVHKGQGLSAFLFEVTIWPSGAIAVNLNFIHLWDK